MLGLERALESLRHTTDGGVSDQRKQLEARFEAGKRKYPFWVR